MKSQKQSSQSSQSSQKQPKKSKRPHTCIGASCPVCKASQDGREAREYARLLAQTAPKAAAAAVWGGLRWEQLPPVPRRLRRNAGNSEKPMRDASILAMFGASQVRFGSDRLAAALKDLALLYGEELPGDAVPKWTAPGCDSRREGTMRLLFDRLQAELEGVR